jgi:hypothetical protein
MPVIDVRAQVSLGNGEISVPVERNIHIFGELPMIQIHGAVSPRLVKCLGQREWGFQIKEKRITFFLTGQLERKSGILILPAGCWNKKRQQLQRQ